MYPQNLTLAPDAPDFSDLPWQCPLSRWHLHTNRLEELPHGDSRHPVVFANYGGDIYAVKELPPATAEEEYTLLARMIELRLPAVTPIGHARTQTSRGDRSILITRFLDYSIPFQILFRSKRIEDIQEYLLDAITSLLVQLHLAGIFWGDCSLSNTLFRRDAGALRAYLVDAETAEIYPGRLQPALRHHELIIMEENLVRDMSALSFEGSTKYPQDRNLGAYIRLRYQSLWEKITQEIIIKPGEHFRIQEQIRSMNDLGFSVGDVELETAPDGSQLHLRVEITDRNFHRDQFLSLTGLDAEEKQAQKLVNEIKEIRAILATTNNRATPLSVAAYHWMNNVFQPTLEILEIIKSTELNQIERYCQLLEHKWYLSERAQHDVGHASAAEDLVKIISQTNQ